MEADLAVMIVRFVDAHQPGWVECDFFDAHGHCHILREKVPGFTAADLGPQSLYPQSGAVRCEVLSHSVDAFGRSIFHITTARPCDIESAEGVTEFDVLSSQLSG